MMERMESAPVEFRSSLAREWYIVFGAGAFLLIVLLFYYNQTIRASGIIIGGYVILNFLVILAQTRVTSVSVDGADHLSICVKKKLILNYCYTYEFKEIRWKSKERVSFRGLRFKQLSLLCNGQRWTIQSNRLGWNEPEVDRLEVFLKSAVENLD